MIKPLPINVCPGLPLHNRMHVWPCTHFTYLLVLISHLCHSVLTADFITKDLTRQRRVVEDPTSPSPTPTPPSLPPGILSSYKINLEFNLADDLKDISRADLLLYQLPTLTGANIEPRDYQQFVEIRTVIGDLEERHVVEGKYINTFDTGYKVFEITNAVKLWVLRNIRGNVTLEVVIYCYRSPNCASQGPDGKFPAKVEFLYAANETERAPRVIIISTNPLEHKDSGKYKRSTHSTTPDFCADDESMCCLKPLTIDFKRDLGIYSIVQPTTLDANYCEGICPQISGLGVMTPQRFEFLRHLGSSHPAASIEPCCAGATYRSLEVLMRKRNPLTGVFYSQIETLQQVEVTSCRCA